MADDNPYRGDEQIEEEEEIDESVRASIQTISRLNKLTNHDPE
jgi:hypothetical protein